MPIDLTKLRKLDPAILALADDAFFLVLVKLHPGAAQPAYVQARAQTDAQLFSSRVSGAQLKQLQADPAVASVAISEKLEIGH